MVEEMKEDKTNPERSEKGLRSTELLWKQDRLAEAKGKRIEYPAVTDSHEVCSTSENLSEKADNPEARKKWRSKQSIK